MSVAFVAILSVHIIEITFKRMILLEKKESAILNLTNGRKVFSRAD
jgi:hypothetical protein